MAEEKENQAVSSKEYGHSPYTEINTKFNNYINELLKDSPFESESASYIGNKQYFLRCCVKEQKDMFVCFVETDNNKHENFIKEVAKIFTRKYNEEIINIIKSYIDDNIMSFSIFMKELGMTFESESSWNTYAKIKKNIENLKSKNNIKENK